MTDAAERTPSAAVVGGLGDAPETGYTVAPGESTLALLRDLAARRTIDGDPAWVMGLGRVPQRDVWGRPRGETPRYTLRTLQLAIAAGWVEVRGHGDDRYRITAAGVAALESAS